MTRRTERCWNRSLEILFWNHFRLPIIYYLKNRYCSEIGFNLEQILHLRFDVRICSRPNTGGDVHRVSSILWDLQFTIRNSLDNPHLTDQERLTFGSSRYEILKSQNMCKTGSKARHTPRKTNSLVPALDSITATTFLFFTFAQTFSIKKEWKKAVFSRRDEKRIARAGNSCISIFGVKMKYDKSSADMPLVKKYNKTSKSWNKMKYFLKHLLWP